MDPDHFVPMERGDPIDMYLQNSHPHCRKIDHPLVNLASALHMYNREMSRSHRIGWSPSMDVTDEKLLAALQRHIPTFTVQPTTDDVLALAIAIALQFSDLHKSLDYLLSTYPGVDMYKEYTFANPPYLVSYNTLYEASIRGGKNILHVLLKHGLDINKPLSFPAGWQQTETKTMFHAICSSCPDAIDLLDHPDTTKFDFRGNTAQMYLLDKLPSENYFIRLYERVRFDVNAPCSTSGITLFEAAIKNRSASPGIIRQLIICGANVRLSNPTNETLLHIAMRMGRTEKDIAEMIAKFTVWGLPIPIDLEKRSDFLNFILDYCDLDINARNHVGETALMYAAANSDYETVKILLERGANSKLRDIYGRTALDRAHNSLFATQENERPNIQTMIIALST